MSKLFLYATLCFLTYTVYAEKIAEYKLNGGQTGVAETKNVIDSAGESKSDAVKRLTFPSWTTVVKFQGKEIPVPGTGVAVGMTLSNGHSFGNGADDELMLDEGPFSIAFKLFYRGQGDFRIIKKRALEIRVFNENGKGHFVGTVIIHGKAYHVWGSPGKVGAWHEYILIFNPARKGIQIFTDGKLTGQYGVPNSPMDSKPKSPLFYQNFGKSKQYLESLVIFDHALSGKEIQELSKK